MFSGIVEGRAKVVAIDLGSAPFRMKLEFPSDCAAVKIGDSICLSGVCLTVVTCKMISEKQWHLEFEMAEETLRRTTLGSLTVGDQINFEHSLQVGGRIHGHFVSGHVDGVSALVSLTPEKTGVRYEWELPEGLSAFIAEKGSVTLSGVSLTVGEVTESSFMTYLIPHTEDVTSLGALKPGDKVNLEVDILARYVQRLLQGGDGKQASSDERIGALLQGLEGYQGKRYE